MARPRRGRGRGSARPPAGPPRAGVECRKDADVINEIPGAYKNLDDVIAAPADLVEIAAHLHTLVCVKG